MGDASRSHERSKNDPVTAFCEDLNGPVEEVSGLIYLASETLTSSPELCQRFLIIAEERVAQLSRVIKSHCRPKPYPLNRAS